MEDNEGVVINGIEVETKKADLMLKKIILKEKINLKTKQYNDGEMVRQIKRMIEEEVQCY